ncbi:hypothetical protein LEMLEM_LOCUS8647 [Lemmus lemmus]
MKMRLIVREIWACSRGNNHDMDFTSIKFTRTAFCHWVWDSGNVILLFFAQRPLPPCGKSPMSSWGFCLIPVKW